MFGRFKCDLNKNPVNRLNVILQNIDEICKHDIGERIAQGLQFQKKKKKSNLHLQN